eukprot:Blabericola_migrator_1__5359@NODE_2747_length_2396_cov_32_079004_g1651_i1_p1_GENE_NODE_2747_length_2396_cov_32_079004_g1651_i1NODE_2747_length_2396_cov_32_079004_g1651_i1_p1_ORF_typecomplete_len540_score87_18Peptidase_S8/PF00082_22/0_00011_NODE_2747_length_2396_cov_32_079004_g1651_i14762095
MAAPIVTGLSALILSLNPTATVADIKWLLRNTLELQDDLQEKFVWGGYPNAYKLILEAAGPTFFFPSGGWQSWRMYETIISQRSSAKIPIHFGGSEPGVQRGSLLVRKMDRKGNIASEYSVNVMVEIVPKAQINVDALPLDGITLRAYPGSPANTNITIQSRGDDSPIGVRLGQIDIKRDGDGIITSDRSNEEIVLMKEWDSVNVTIGCKLEVNDVSTKAVATLGHLTVWGPIGLEQEMTEFVIPITCQAVSLKLVPPKLDVSISKSTPWDTVQITKDAKARLMLFYHFAPTDYTCNSGSNFKKYEVRILKDTNGFIDLATLEDGNVTRVESLHGLDDHHIRYTVKFFKTFYFFNEYHDNLSQIYISTNGILAFDQWKTNNDWNPALDAPIKGEPLKVIAPYWLDILSPPQDLSSHVYVLDTEDRMIVQWTAFSQYGKTGAKYTFQAHLTPPGHIYFAYQTVNAPEENKKLNIGLKNKMDHIKYDLSEFSPKDLLMFARMETKKPVFYTSVSGHSFPMGFSDWESLEPVVVNQNPSAQT